MYPTSDREEYPDPNLIASTNLRRDEVGALRSVELDTAGKSGT